MSPENSVPQRREPSGGRGSSSTGSRRYPWLDTAAPIVAALAFICFVLTQTQFAGVYELNPDEGINVIKARLVEEGYSLYTDIWSDQPPLYTYTLRYFFNQFGWSVENARIVTLLFSSLLILGLYDSVRAGAGHFAAVTSVLMLFLSSSYVALSVSAMVGLPAIALAVTSIWMLVGRQLAPSRWHLAISGILMACSLAVKLFTGFLAPLLGTIVLVSEWQRGGWRRALVSAFVWTTAFALVLALFLGPALSAGAVDQLIGTHALGQLTRRPEGIGKFLLDDAFMFSLAAVGIGVTLTSPRALWIAFTGWLLLAAVGLIDHSPLWYHHCLLLTVPASALAGLGLEAMLHREGSARRGLAGGAVALALLIAGNLYAHPERLKELTEPPARIGKAQANAVERVLGRYAGRIGSMITSRQIYAFRFDLDIPPDLAVTSEKRFKTKNIDTGDILRRFRSFKPDVVLIDYHWPDSTREALVAAMEADYQRVFKARFYDNTEIFIKREVAERTAVAP